MAMFGYYIVADQICPSVLSVCLSSCVTYSTIMAIFAFCLLTRQVCLCLCSCMCKFLSITQQVCLYMCPYMCKLLSVTWFSSTTMFGYHLINRQVCLSDFPLSHHLYSISCVICFIANSISITWFTYSRSPS